LSQDSTPGSSLCGQSAIPIDIPMLLKCDLEGRVLWTSTPPANIISIPRRFLDIIRLQKLLYPVYGLELPVLQFWKVCEFRDSVLIGAAVAPAQLPEAQSLASVHRNLTNNLFRLLELERHLSERARRRRGHTGKSAIRQIELERQRLGRDLHTGVGQMLAAIRWHLEVLSTELPNPSPGTLHALDSISRLTAQSLEQIRDVSRRVHPPEWQRLTLQAAVLELWEISGIPSRLVGTLEIDPISTEPALEVKMLIYRALQEALSNLARHSRATHVEAGLRLIDSRLVLSVRDNGVGFDVAKFLSAPANLTSGIGLRSIRETALELGGTFSVESGAAGTTLVISVAHSPSGTGI
jgi:signal transduction histidine kinase